MTNIYIYAIALPLAVFISWGLAELCWYLVETSIKKITNKIFFKK